MLSCQCCDLGFWKYSSTACSVSYYTCCTIFGKFRCFWAVCRLFFLQSGSVVLDCGQTPPQHAQCHITLAAQVQVFSFFLSGESHIYSIPMLHCSTKEAYYQHVTWNQHLRCRPYHVECTGSLLTSEVKRHRARLVLGWGTAWEDLRVLPALLTQQGQDQDRRRGRGKGEGEGEGEGEEEEEEEEAEAEAWPLPLASSSSSCFKDQKS